MSAPDLPHAEGALLRRLEVETGLPTDRLRPGSSVARRYIPSSRTGGLRGFHLTIGKASAAGGASYTWSVETAVNGRSQRLRVANAKLTPMETALQAAKDVKRDASHGADPKEERAREVAQKREAQASKRAARRTVREVLDMYLERQRKNRRPSAEQLAQFYAEPTSRTLKIKGVNRTQLKPILKDLDKAVGTYTEERAQRLVSLYAERGLRMEKAALDHMHAAFNMIVKDIKLSKAFGIAINPFARVKLTEPPNAGVPEDAEDDNIEGTAPAVSDDGEGTRALSANEIKALWEGLHAVSKVSAGNGAMLEVRTDDATRIALLLVLTTGQRVDQVLRTRVRDLDLEAGIWSIPLAHRKIKRKLVQSNRPKDKGPHEVPLHSMAVELWRQALALRTNAKNHWVFPAYDRQGGEVTGSRDHRTLNRFVTRWCMRTGFKHFTPRDLRRTWTTQAGRWRLSYEIRERIMDHALPGIGADVYDEGDYLDQKRDLMNDYDGFLSAMLSGDERLNKAMMEAQRHGKTDKLRALVAARKAGNTARVAALEAELLDEAPTESNVVALVRNVG